MRNGENEKQEGGQKWRQKLMKGKVKKKKIIRGGREGEGITKEKA